MGDDKATGPSASVEAPRVVRPARRIYEPTEQERLEHETAGCVPYRAWCRHCVAGRGRSGSHWQHGRSDHAFPTIAFDYGYLGDREEDERASPILVVKCDKDRCVDSELLPGKGLVHPHNAKTLVQCCVRSGYSRFFLKCDNENPIRALRREAMKILSATHGKEVIPEDPAVGESQSNGLAENAVKEVKGVVRSLKHFAEELHGATINQQHAVLPWLVKYAGATISRRQLGTDGRTAFELRKDCSLA